MRLIHYLTICALLATPCLASGRATPALRVEDLAFFAGDWDGELFGGVADESWMPPRAGTMLGVFRLLWPDSGKRLYEFLVIEETPDGVVTLNFRHFDPGMKLWKDEIDKPRAFVLKEVSGRRAVFEAPDRSQEPARFVFAVDDAGKTLTVTVASLDAEGAVKDSFEAAYRRR